MIGMGRHRLNESTFRMLFVCTGNICRSPFAEILTRHLLTGRLGPRAATAFDVSSAGVQAVVGSAMHPSTRAELAPWRLDGASDTQHFTARQLRSAMVTDADLVLGATTRHRSAVVECHPAGLATSFSIREFARLAADVDQRELPTEPVARAHELVEQVRRRRGVSPPGVSEEDRVPDPMGGPQRAHHDAAVLIEDAVTTIVDVVAPPLSRLRARA
jgi:protein-tyrosine phosphatase